MNWLISAIIGFIFIASVRSEENATPFSIHLSPNKSHITIGDDPRSFYVILRNTSTEDQKVFEQWNSWGYRNIMFEITEGNRKHRLIMKPQNFTRNFPSIYLIPPGELMVFRFTLDDDWENLPKLPEGESDIIVRVIYKSTKCKESAKQGVWTGEVKSAEYKQKIWSYKKQ